MADEAGQVIVWRQQGDIRRGKAGLRIGGRQRGRGGSAGGQGQVVN